MSNPNPDTSGLSRAPKCSRLRQRDRQPCRAFAVRGSDPPACRKHIGRSRTVVKAEQDVRETVLAWGLGDSKVDPGELLLRLVAQAAIRADAYATELRRIVEDTDGDLRKALTGNTYTVTPEGDSVKTGEYVRAMTKLEGEERDRAASFAAKAVAAGLAERQVRLAERQAELAAQFVNAVLADLGLAGTPQATAAIQRHLTLLAPSA
jgi:hypothetical protein